MIRNGSESFGPFPPCLEIGLSEMPSGRRKLGLIAVDVDEVIEDDFRHMSAGIDEVGMVTSRFRLGPLDALGNTAPLEQAIAGAAGLLAPRSDLDAVVFGCASASLALGQDKVERIVRDARQRGVSVITPLGASIAAMEALNVGSVLLVTPYPEAIDAGIRAAIGKAGVAVKASVRVPTSAYRQFSDVPGSVVADLVLAALRDVEADCALVSCTALRVSPLIQAMERESGKPVLASNQCALWSALRLLGCSRMAAGYGRLMETLPPAATGSGASPS